MKKLLLTILTLPLFVLCGMSQANTTQKTPVDTLPLRVLSIAAPMPAHVDSFITLIQKELGPRGINGLLLRVDFNYQWKSHPELIDTAALSESDVKKIVKACKKEGIRIIPQINLMGHQSWQSHLGKLLAEYPQFDETPWVQIPEKYQWPNADGLYCKSYCPLHPDVHKVVFDLMDEICEVFGAKDFHAGMDEVFYIADSKCPRCGGHDPAELYAGEVTKTQKSSAAKWKEIMDLGRSAHRWQDYRYGNLGSQYEQHLPRCGYDS